MSRRVPIGKVTAALRPWRGAAGLGVYLVLESSGANGLEIP